MCLCTVQLSARQLIILGSTRHPAVLPWCVLVGKARIKLLISFCLKLSSPFPSHLGSFWEVTPRTQLMLQRGSAVKQPWDPTRGKVPGLCCLCLLRPLLGGWRGFICISKPLLCQGKLSPLCCSQGIWFRVGMASTAGSPAVLKDNTEYPYRVGGNYTRTKAPPTSEVVCLHHFPGQVRNPELLEQKSQRGWGPAPAFVGLTGAGQATPWPPVGGSGHGWDQHSNSQGYVST